MNIISICAGNPNVTDYEDIDYMSDVIQNQIGFYVLCGDTNPSEVTYQTTKYIYIVVSNKPLKALLGFIKKAKYFDLKVFFKVKNINDWEWANSENLQKVIGKNITKEERKLLKQLKVYSKW